MPAAIKVKNLSKACKLREIGTAQLSPATLKNGLQKLRRKEANRKYIEMKNLRSDIFEQIKNTWSYRIGNIISKLLNVLKLRK